MVLKRDQKYSYEVAKDDGWMFGDGCEEDGGIVWGWNGGDEDDVLSAMPDARVGRRFEAALRRVGADDIEPAQWSWRPPS